MFVTGRLYCDFVVWTTKEIYIERILPDEDLVELSLPIAEQFFKQCILPELLGKWYTQETVKASVDEDDGFCKQVKGGSMVECESKQCSIKCLSCVCMSESAVPDKWICSVCQN